MEYVFGATGAAALTADAWSRMFVDGEFLDEQFFAYVKTRT